MAPSLISKKKIIFDFFSGDNKLVTLGAVATASGVALGALWYRHYQKNKIPQQWTKIGELEGLYIYPVKSCGFVKEDSLECTEIGFRNANIRDRYVLSILKNPKLAFIGMTVTFLAEIFSPHFSVLTL